MTTDTSLGDPGKTLAAIRERKPLVHAITNYLALDLTANLLLALGAAPVLARSAEEAALIAGRADALLVNIGMANSADVAVMVEAAGAAKAAGRPWVLDPVGVGATPFRLEAARRLADLGPDVIRGNAAEIGRLGSGQSGDGENGGGRGSNGRGVDSLVGPEAVLESAKALALESGALVAVTGRVDLVTDGHRVIRLANGDPLMTRVSGLGCALGALVAAALSARPADPLGATLGALALLAVAGERAAADCRGPGSFRVSILDELAVLEPGQVDAAARITEEARA